MSASSVYPNLKTKLQALLKGLLTNSSMPVATENPYLSAEFQALLDRGKDLAKDVHSTLEACTVPNWAQQGVSRLLAESACLSKFVPVDTRTIAILGGAGEGRISLPV